MTSVALARIRKTAAQTRRPKKTAKSAAYHAFMFALVALYLFPVAWAFSMSLRTNKNLFAVDQLIPHPITFEHYVNLFNALPDIGQYFANTFEIAIIGTAATLVTSSMAGYALARLRFPGRNLYVVLVLLTLMIPAQTTLVPQYVVFRELGWTGTILPIVATAFFGITLGNALPTFFFRQFYLTLPAELEQAAAVDGASRARTFTAIIAPLTTPAYLAIGMLVFVQYYNSFFLNSVFVQRQENWTVTQALQSLVGQYNSQYGEIMAGVTLVSLPMLVLYLFLQRWIIRGIAMTGNAN